MLTAVTAFAVAVLTGLVLTPAVRNWAIRRGVLDHVSSSRKIHGAPVPRIGGLAIVGAYYIPLIGLLFVDNGVARMFRSEPLNVVGLFAGGLAIAGLGIYDDLKGANARQKLGVQVAVALLMYALGYRIDVIANPFGGEIQLGLLGLPFTLLWFTGVVNAMNLIDGLDGLAGGVAFIGIGSTFAVAVLRGDPLLMLFSAALAGAVLGFLFYNFNPASIFMGDSGSMFLGFVLAASAAQTHQKSSAAVALLAPVVALGLPIGDTLLAMSRRALRGRPVFKADREHIHHLLLAKGWTHRRACLTLYAIAALLGAAGVALAHAASGWAAVLILVPLVSAAVLFLHWLGYARIQQVPELAVIRRRNLETRARIKAIGDSLRRAREAEQVWRNVREAAPVLGACCVSLKLVGWEQGSRTLTEFSEGFDDAGAALFRARYTFDQEQSTAVSMELGWSDGRAHVDRDTEIAVEMLCTHVENAVERLGATRDRMDGVRMRRGA